VSLPLKNASIVDIVWGAGFVVVAWVAYAVGDGTESRRLLLACMVTLWGGRLAVYLYLRNHGKGEDPRYAAMRKRRGDAFAVQSLWLVFGLQGVLMWIVSLPVQVGSVADQPTSLGPVEIVGIIVFTVGVYFEAMGDLQLSQFKADPRNEGQVMDQGLWRYTRHPNYFGDFCVWWGLYAIAIATGDAWWAVAGPLIMSALLLRVSGVTLLERHMQQRKPGYEHYARRTSAFFPRPPRAG
jgi:steroid 5-alpha reductase family enzyme